MKVLFHKKAQKFLEKLNDKEKEKIRIKIKELAQSIENNGLIPYQEIDVKNLFGEWADYLRLRVGEIRIIFSYDKNDECLFVADMNYRGNIY